MNNELFEQANQAYGNKDYQTALQVFTQCLQEEGQPAAPGEIGLIYHQIGNCLVKLKNSREAIQAYTQATLDTEYREIGTVNCNLGMAYASMHDYENAVKCYEAAVADPNYATPYKAYSGLGSALIKLGKSAEAGAAFRSAALDEGNPDPTKALLNLGVCFMALGRPNDAIFSYESALQFRMQPATRNKIYSSLGQAYVAAGQMQKAVDAFDHAIADKTYFLSDSASVDYQRAIGAVAQGTATDMAPITASMAAAAQAPQADTSGLDVVDPSYEAAAQDAAPAQLIGDFGVAGADGIIDPLQQAPVEGDPSATGAWTQPVNAEGVENFFGEGAEWEKPKKRHTGLKVAIVILILLILAAGAAIFGYTQGYGYPTQETVAAKLFADPSDKDVYSDAVTDAKIAGFASFITPDSAATIDGVEKSMSDSTVYVTSKTKAGGSVKYRVTMVRDKIGWKVANVELFFASQYGSGTQGQSSAATNSNATSNGSAANGNGAQADPNATNGNGAQSGQNAANGNGAQSGQNAANGNGAQANPNAANGNGAQGTSTNSNANNSGNSSSNPQ